MTPKCLIDAERSVEVGMLEKAFPGYAVSTWDSERERSKNILKS